jgi:hypothetical protein
VGYTPSAFGSGTHTLATAYPGDAEHTASAGHGTVSVIPPGPTGPVLSGVRLAQRKFRAKAGTTLSFTLNEPATVTGAITRTVRGHKVHGHCRVKARHGRRCSLVVPAGRATFAGVAGANSARFRLSRLRAGRYQMTAIARDAAGQTSPPVMIRFTVTKPRRRH